MHNAGERASNALEDAHSLVRSIYLHMLHFLRGTKRGLWAGAELGCHFIEGKVKNFR